MLAAPPVQVAPAERRRSRRPRATAALLAAPVLAGLVPGVAQGQDFAYTGECSHYSGRVDDKPSYRAFRARFLRNSGDGAWSLPGYDYTYTIDRGLEWGPHSDERIEFDKGRVTGPSSWHSPDSHTSNVSWVAERGWKAAGDKYNTILQAHAWFDVPSQNDPECDVYTAEF